MGGVDTKLAVLFADISGSAKLYERLGDAEALRAVDRCIKRMERAVDGFGGRLVKTVGDEMQVTFATAESAFQAAIDMQQRVSDLPPVSGVKLAIRVGLHCGQVTECDGELAGDTVTTAARITGAAEPGQILASGAAAADLPANLREVTRAAPLSADKSGGIQLVEVQWHKTDEVPARSKVARLQSAAAAHGEPEEEAGPKLCIRYRGRAYLLDDKTPILTLGRDSESDLVIEDRKASRQHARVERRGDIFFYVDRSTNGSYVAVAGEQEAMVRKEEIVLRDSGVICFGSSANDPTADCAHFEHL